MKRLPLTKGKEALVDDGDYDFLMQWKWCTSGQYAVRKARKAELAPRQQVLMHRVVADRAGCKVTGYIDHKDGNGLNNRRSNLRPANYQNNTANSRPPRNNTSGYKGVSRNGSKWLARIHVYGQTHYLGRFDSKSDAARAYNAVAVKYFGEFAYLNPV